jgi:hypothetical protein
MDDTLSKALKKKEFLQSELRRVDDFIALYHQLFDTGEPDQPVENGDSESAQVTPTAPKKRGRPSEIVNAAQEVIREANRPLSRGELVDRLEARGIGIASADKPRYVGTILWRNQKTFTNIEGEGYWIRGMPLPGSFNGGNNLFAPPDKES